MFTKKSYFSCVLSISTVIVLLLILTDAKLTLKLDKIVCSAINPKRVINASCNVKAINRYYRVGNFEGFLTKPTHIKVHLKLFRRTNGWHPFIIDVREDICRFFQNKKLLPFMDIFYNLALRYTNLNHTCPYEGLIFARNFNLNSTEVFSFFPVSQYLASIELKDGKEHLGLLDVYFVVKEL